MGSDNPEEIIIECTTPGVAKPQKAGITPWSDISLVSGLIVLTLISYVFKKRKKK